MPDFSGIHVLKYVAAGATFEHAAEFDYSPKEMSL
jgi:hypothetical protein